MHIAVSTLLRNFCEDESLVNANMHKNADIDYTYCNYASGTTSVIDHFLLTEQAYDSIFNVHVVHSGTNLSDHDPLILQMRAPHQTIKTSDECRSRKVNWHQNQNQKCFYSILTKSIYKVTMKRFWIRGPLLRPAWSLT